MEPLNGITILEKLAQLRCMIILQISTAFAGYTAARVGVKVMTRREFVDTVSGEPFEVWSGVRGLRLLLISKLL